MASPGNPNQQQLFRPSANPNPNNMVPPSGSSAPYPPPSSSYPPPTGPYPFHHPQYLPYPPPPLHTQQEHQFFPHQPPHQLHSPQRPGPFVAHPSPASPNPGGARLMALLGTQNPSPTPDLPPHPFTQSPSAPPEFLISVRPPGQAPSAPPVNLLAGQSSPMRLLSTKLPKGRHLTGDHVIYDVDVRLPGEVQPQLEVTPITKYVSDPGLVLGRQIAVNRSYICYGLKMGNIRVLNINTALRSLLRGHTQRVTDMTFFAEDVHLLASASNDGRVFIWKINEGPNEEDKAQIAGKVVVAIQFVGEEESVHPQLCWHPHKQENLIVAIGKRILKIDTTRIRKAGAFSAEEPIKCPLEKLIDGVQLVGEHDDVVTNVSMCQWMTTRLASASLDGTVKIWEDRKQSPLTTIRPHDGHPVNSVTFFTSPHRPDHIVLVTGGPVNRVVKIWSSTSEEGWLLPSDSESWQCNQTLELRSSAEAKVDDAFFNQVVALQRAGLVLLANAKKNAIYALHIDYGMNPSATRIDYMSEFTVTMPILSVTGTSESLAEEDHIVQVYCVQTQAIQQYALALSQCLPPPLDHAEIEKTESAVSSMVDAVSAEIPANVDVISDTEATTSNVTPMPPLHSNTSAGIASLLETAVSPRKYDNIRAATPPPPVSPKISRLSSGFSNPPLTDHNSDHQATDYSASGETLKKHDNSADLLAVSGPGMFKHPTHLVTPSEILFRAPSSETHISQGMNIGEVKVQDVAANSSVDSVEVDVKIVDSQNTAHDYERESNVIVSEKKEQSFYSQASSLSMQLSKECSDDNYNVDGTEHAKAADLSDHAPIGGGADQDSSNIVSEKVGEAEASAAVHGQSSSTKGKKKGKTSQVVVSSSPSPSPFNSTDLPNVPETSSSLPSADGALPHLSTMQKMLNQLVGMQREMQKQMHAVVSGPVNKEGKRLETSLGRNMERIMKANSDALWSRFVEESAKQEKLERERTQNLTNLINNFNKDLEKTIKKEINAVGPAVVRAITPLLEKSISSAITDSFQKGVGDKTVNQLEKSVSSKLEGTVSRQIQVQFQTSGKQALQEGLRAGLDASVIPSFEVQCKAMFDQIDATFQNGLANHLAAAQKQFDSAHSPLAIALRDTMNSALTMSQTLSGELADGQRKLIAIAGAAGVSNMSNPLVSQLSNGPLAGLREIAEAPVDPTKELSRLIAERKYEEAFNAALQRSDVSIVSWLCSQVDLPRILALVPVPLSQGVLLALLQQLACDISTNTAMKLGWMTEVTVAINPADPMIVVHIRPIFDQVYQILAHQRGLPTRSASEVNSIRLLMHVINSVLMSCK